MGFFAGLWKVCEKYRKLMNELAQVSTITHYNTGIVRKGNEIIQVFFTGFLQLNMNACDCCVAVKI